MKKFKNFIIGLFAVIGLVSVCLCAGYILGQMNQKESNEINTSVSLTPTPTSTPSPKPTATSTPTPTPSSEPTATSTPTPTNTITPTSAPKYTFTDMAVLMQAAHNLNVYDEPNEDSNKIDEVLTDKVIAIKGICNETGFYSIEYYSQNLKKPVYGYADSKYFKDYVAPTKAPTPDPTEAPISNDNKNDNKNEANSSQNNNTTQQVTPKPTKTPSQSSSNAKKQEIKELMTTTENFLDTSYANIILEHTEIAPEGKTFKETFTLLDNSANVIGEIELEGTVMVTGVPVMEGLPFGTIILIDEDGSGTHDVEYVREVYQIFYPDAGVGVMGNRAIILIDLHEQTGGTSLQINPN